MGSKGIQAMENSYTFTLWNWLENPVDRKALLEKVTNGAGEVQSKETRCVPEYWIVTYGAGEWQGGKTLDELENTDKW